MNGGAQKEEVEIWYETEWSCSFLFTLLFLYCEHCHGRFPFCMFSPTPLVYAALRLLILF